jgi:gamma-glutamylcyclotransferase (GGCT)/AIG2-like uncharacterized protein YtfP
MTADGTKTYTAFFYGTLTASQVLARVLTGELALPTNTPIVLHRARLDGYRRFSVKGEEYPAVRPREGEQVVGAVAYGLSELDVAKLDVFEGDEYKRVELDVVDLEDAGRTVRANMYLWVDGENRLEPTEWDLEHFQT